MCEPTTILAIGSAVVGTIGKRQAAKKQMKGMHRQRVSQAEEISAKAGASAGERVKQGRAERARLRVAGGEAGVAGSSFEATLMDSALQEDLDIAAINKNAEFSQRGSEAGYQSGLAGVANPSLLESGLQIGAAGYAAHSAAQGVDAQIPDTAPQSTLKIPTSRGH